MGTFKNITMRIGNIENVEKEKGWSCVFKGVVICNIISSKWKKEQGFLFIETKYDLFVPI